MITIEIDQRVLDEVSTFVNQHLVADMSDRGVSINAMAFILQSILNAVDMAQEALDEDENI